MANPEVNDRRPLRVIIDWAPAVAHPLHFAEPESSRVLSGIAFPVSWVDHSGAAWTGYASRVDDRGNVNVVCDDGTQLYPDGEDVTWMHGHFTKRDPEMLALLAVYALGDT